MIDILTFKRNGHGLTFYIHC